MTEKEYINATDLGKIQCVKDIITRIRPEISDIIDLEEYKQVYKIIRKWEIKLFDSINTDDL